MKLVGGPKDGKHLSVLEDGRDYVRFARIEATVPFGPGNGVALPAPVETVTYTRRKLHFPQGNIEFFAPDTMSDFEAVQHQFAK